MSKMKRCRCVVSNPSAIAATGFNAAASGIGPVVSVSSGGQQPGCQNPGCQKPGCGGGCVDVCTSPICATPNTLTLMAPVIYDQLGINLCSPVELTGLETYPTAVSASVQVIDVAFGDDTEITQLTGRANCYQITLSELTVTFAIRLFDNTGKVLATLTETAVYLPEESADNYDEETNPSSVEFSIFAPYGISYIDGSVDTPLLNYVGFSSTNAMLLQGLNATAYAKLLNLDTDDGVATIGLTVYVASIYFAQYQFGDISRAEVPKVSPIPEEDTLCQNFVDGDLLNLAIKPLELGAPLYEENLKNPCPRPGGCGSLVPIDNNSPSLPLADDSTIDGRSLTADPEETTQNNQ